jgi:hypothetical protein
MSALAIMRPLRFAAGFLPDGRRFTSLGCKLKGRRRGDAPLTTPVELPHPFKSTYHPFSATPNPFEATESQFTTMSK